MAAPAAAPAKGDAKAAAKGGEKKEAAKGGDKAAKGGDKKAEVGGVLVGLPLLLQTLWCSLGTAREAPRPMGSCLGPSCCRKNCDTRREQRSKLPP